MKKPLLHRLLDDPFVAAIIMTVAMVAVSVVLGFYAVGIVAKWVWWKMTGKRGTA